MFFNTIPQNLSSNEFRGVIQMGQLDDELKKEIEKGTTLAKVDPDELKKREEEKKQRMEELAKLKEALGDQVEEE